LIPQGLVRKLAKKHGVDRKARTFTPWSHVVSMLFGQISHAIGLNDICDNLYHHSGPLSAIRGARAPARNTLSHANKHRSSDMAQALFWSMLTHLQKQSKGFGPNGRYAGLPHRIRRTVHAVDSTVITLVANCIDWAKHRRRKAAAKCHLRLNLQTFLPNYAVVDTAKENDARRARELCAGLHEGEIVVFDKAYVDFDHLHDLENRGVIWVTRSKDNMRYRVVKRALKKPEGNILRDDIILLTGAKSHKSYPMRFRLIRALVELDGKETVMTFITNHLDWAASTICDLYRSRWAIEVFFKQIKQTLKLSDFVGHSANAVKWQIWTALLTWLLLRYLAYLSKWSHAFNRISTIIRGVIWDRYDLQELLQYYGTAEAKFRMAGHPENAYLPGFAPKTMGQPSRVT